MKRTIVRTADGSSTIALSDVNEQYHSKHGAVQEAKHVFIKMGLEYILSTNRQLPLRILEMGMGTGLNTLLTLEFAEKYKKLVHYTALEAFPISLEEQKKLNYQLVVASEYSSFYYKIHEAKWGEECGLSPFFKLKKIQTTLEEYNFQNKFDVVFYDAFGPRVQPELWTLEIFEKMFKLINPKGVLVTYSAKGSVRRNMIQAGFEVDKLPGPPGKREMLRAVKAI